MTGRCTWGRGILLTGALLLACTVEGEDVARDYYLARDWRGAWLWLFRDLRRGGWNLHGFFD